MTTPTSPLFQAPLLVGRERELGVLRQHLDAAIAGHGSLVLIGGEAGIGKTALAEALCRDAADDGALVLVGRCYDLSETPPYGPWVELFSQYRPIDCSPPPPASFAQRGTVTVVASQAALFQQTFDFCSAFTGTQPLVLLLDDIHWADPASIDLLRYLARYLATASLMIVATYRTEDIVRGHPLSALLPALVREARSERLALRPLDAPAVHALITIRYPLSAADMTQLVTYVQARAEGNPFYVRELLRTLEDETLLWQTEQGAWALGDVAQARVPALVQQVIEARLARLNAAMRRLLVVAAVIGQDVPLALWGAVAEADEETLLAAVEVAAESRLIEEMPDGTGMRFLHALIRAALYDGTRPLRRRRIHQQIAELLAVRPNADPDAVAYHFQQADDHRAIEWLLRAGERAQAAYAWTTAAGRFEAAISLMERTNAHAGELGWLLLRVSRLIRYVEAKESRAFADRAYAFGERVDDRALAAYARFQRGNLGCITGDVAFGLPEMEAGAAALMALSATERAHFAAHAAAITASSGIPDERGGGVLWLSFVGHLRAAQELGERLIREVADDDASLQRISEGLCGLGDAYAALGMPEAASAMHARGHEVDRRANQHAPASHSLMRELDLAALPYQAENIAAVRQLADRTEAEWVRVSGAIPDAGSPHFARLPLLVLEGRWADAERLALAGSQEMRGIISQRAMALKYLAPLARLRGNSHLSWWAIHEWLPFGTATKPGTVAFFDCVITLQRVAAQLALDDHDLPTAEAWLEQHERWLAWSEAVLGRSEGQTLWARYYRAADDMERAYECAAHARALASEPRQPLALLATHRLLGELDTDDARFTDAETHLNAALVLADACAAPFERALTLLAAAELHAATARHGQARVIVEQVRTLCAPLGAQPTLVRADALAARLADAETRPAAYPAHLSEREVEVLRLLVQGMSNRAIAARLYFSVRTVERHVRNLYTKINAHNRVDATAYAFRHHLA